MIAFNASSPSLPSSLLQEVANEFNAKKVESTVITMARLRPKDKNVLFSTKVYGPTGFQQWASRAQHSDDNNGKLFFVATIGLVAHCDKALTLNRKV